MPGLDVLQEMKNLNTAILLLICSSALQSVRAFDPFADADSLGAPPAENAQRMIKTNFICTASGTLEGQALDARVKTIVIAISEFHKAHKRVPKGIEELFTFCDRHGLTLHDLSRLSSVVFIGGTFKYSASYGAGTLHLSHISGCYLSSDMMERKEAEHVMDVNRP